MKTRKPMDEASKIAFSEQEIKTLKRLWKSQKRPVALFRIKALFNAFHGIIYPLFSQRNFQIHSLVSTLAILAGLYFKISLLEWFFVIICIAMVLMAELFNTAIEILTDLVTKKHKIRAMLAKDIGVGAVFIAVLAATIMSYFVFFDRIVSLLRSLS